MKGLKKVLSSPAFSTISFLLAGVLLFFGGIGGARAALQYYSDDYQAEMDVHDIGVSLLENGERVSYRDYIGRGQVDSSNLSTDEQKNWDHSSGLDSLDDDIYDPLLVRFSADYDGEDKEEFKLGKKYKEEISVRNSGTVDQYVRVTIYKYWLIGTEKDRELKPTQIDLHLNEANVGEGKDWVIDKDSSTDERTVLYYTKLLKCEANLKDGESNETSTVTDTLMVDPDVARIVTQDAAEKKVDGKTYKTLTTTYDYDGRQFCVEARVDAVQDHHADDAVLSAWGREVTVSNGSLSLK